MHPIFSSFSEFLRTKKNSIFFCNFFHNQSLELLDELVMEKEKYKDIGDDLDTAFVELILKE